jgi:non-heme chloroperoxidase
MAQVEIRSGSVRTTDGVLLRYVEAGEGPDLLLVAGWTLTADLWQRQIAEFSRTHHVVAYDHRGQGMSDAPGYGYRVTRLAADARELILTLGLTDVTWVGHSMGCSVAWAYWDLYGGIDVGRLVLIDGPAVQVSLPDWPSGAAEELGAILNPEGLAEFIAAVRGPLAREAATGVFGLMCSPDMTEHERGMLVDRSLLTDRAAASALLFNHATQDWRDVLPRITVPTLVIGAEGSLFPATAIKNLSAAIVNSSTVIIPAADKGSHMAFYENPSAVNSAIRAFLIQNVPG